MRTVLVSVLCVTLAVLLLLPAAAGAADYVYVDQWGSNGTAAGQFWGGATGVATDRFGTVWAVSGSDSRVERFTPAGAFMSQFASACTNAWNIGVDRSGNVYVPDWSLDRVRVFDPSGAALFSFGSTGSGNGQLSGPLAIDVAADGTIYVADTFNNRVEVFDKTGAYVNKWGTVGTGNGEFNYATGIDVDDNAGKVYVADFGNGRIQVFDLAGTYLDQFGNLGSGDEILAFPYGVTLDGHKHLLVADSNNDRVAIFATDDGGWVGALGTFGSGTGQFNEPVDVAIDASGALYVADRFNYRVQKFAYDDTPPVVTHDYDGEWHNGGVLVTLTATDDLSAPGVIALSHRVDGGPWLGGTAFTIAAPSDHSNDGAHKVEYNATDDASNQSATKTIWVKIDTKAPHTTASGVPSGWTQGPVVIDLAATDIGSGVGGTWWALDSDPYALLDASGQATVSLEGSHSLYFWSYDTVVDSPNQENTKHVDLLIDNTAPTPVTPLAGVTVRHGRSATFRFDADDALSPTLTARIVITKKTKVVKTFRLAPFAPGLALGKKLKITLATGAFTWSLQATDLAGNTTVAAVSKKLTVRP